MLMPRRANPQRWDGKRRQMFTPAPAGVRLCATRENSLPFPETDLRVRERTARAAGRTGARQELYGHWVRAVIAPPEAHKTVVLVRWIHDESPASRKGFPECS